MNIPIETIDETHKFVQWKPSKTDILKSRPVKLLQKLADLNLIAFRKSVGSLKSVIRRLRQKASAIPPALDEITKEVKSVRSNGIPQRNDMIVIDTITASKIINQAA